MGGEGRSIGEGILDLRLSEVEERLRKDRGRGAPDATSQETKKRARGQCQSVFRGAELMTYFACFLL